ncbi:MAG TPA: long-chain fatty acid--CoA ligase [Sporichthyaceae bacterium]|jgi:long-chain acyl-CoA synthetase|nr:long-chain fatty acid--CoA ligase [Sporichthyaceae bacterium]
MTNLATILVETLGRHADRVAVRFDDQVLSYREMDERSARIAGRLRESGLQPGDRVGLMLPNVPAFPVLYYGVLRAGGIVVPMNPLLKSREVKHYLADSGARVMFAWHTVRAEAQIGAEATGVECVPITEDTLSQTAALPFWPDVAPRADDDTAVILYTSGTTGTPKGAQLTHANLRTNAAVAAESLLGLGHEDVIVGCLPLFHAFGQTCALNAAVVSGAAISLMARFDAATVLKVIERDRASVFAGVPTMFIAMLDAGAQVADTSTLRLCISGGAALPVEVLNAFCAVFGVPILEGYGLSETSPVASFNHLGHMRPGSIGHPVQGVQMKVVDDSGVEVATGEVGEIAIRGHNVMRGYWNRPEATAEAIRDGWFLSGDIGRVDADGFFYIVDRKKELIIRGGFNVYPREIEEVLYEHPAVLEAAVVGIPHPTHGEEVAAAVALKPGGEATAEQIRDWVKERVAAYKYPRVVWLVDALPKGPTGKVLKREIVPPGGR